MALIGNYSVLNKTPGVFRSGTSVSDNRSNMMTPGGFRARYTGWNYFTRQDGFPVGYTPPYSFIIPQYAGGLASINNVNGAGNLTNSNLAGGLNGVSTIPGTATITSTILGSASIISIINGTSSTNFDISALGIIIAAIAGSGDITIANGSLAALMVSSLSGSGTISNASIAGALYAASNITGTGSISADIAGALNATADLIGSSSINADILGSGIITTTLSGNGSISNANADSIANMLVALAGNGDIAAAIRADAMISASINVASSDPLSPTSLAAAVWDEDLTTHNIPNSAGYDLQNVSSGSSPAAIAQAVWDQPTTSNTTSGTFGTFVKKLLTVAKYLGLK